MIKSLIIEEDIAENEFVEITIVLRGEEYNALNRVMEIAALIRALFNYFSLK